MDKESLIGYWSVKAIKSNREKEKVGNSILYKINNDDSINYAVWHNGNWQKQENMLLTKYTHHFYFKLGERIYCQVKGMEKDVLILDCLIENKIYFCERLKFPIPTTD